ncbi:MAG TPA: hypothetical protein VFK44_09355 [Bacillales bacterium]|nr:hypothetical protein [Bacillales bacterium]
MAGAGPLAIIVVLRRSGRAQAGVPVGASPYSVPGVEIELR